MGNCIKLVLLCLCVERERFRERKSKELNNYNIKKLRMKSGEERLRGGRERIQKLGFLQFILLCLAWWKIGGLFACMREYCIV